MEVAHPRAGVVASVFSRAILTMILSFSLLLTSDPIGLLHFQALHLLFRQEEEFKNLIFLGFFLLPTKKGSLHEGFLAVSHCLELYYMSQSILVF